MTNPTAELFYRLRKSWLRRLIDRLFVMLAVAFYVSCEGPQVDAGVIPPRFRANLIVVVSPWHDIQQRNKGWIWGGERLETVGYTVTDEHKVIIGRTPVYNGDTYDFHPHRQHLFVIPPEMRP